jgi:flagellar hook protein FlgE
MSLFSTLNVGASGLGMASTGLGIAGDNISNIGTTGYKQTRATFADFLPQDVFGLAGNGRMGTGVATNRVSTLFGQGTIDASDSALDMAISGNGFFVVNSATQSFYTRNGEFYLDTDGFVTTASGLRLQGYPATGGALSPIVGDLQVTTAALPGQATATMTMNAALAADTETGTDLAALDFFGTGAGTNTITEAAEAADFSTSMTVYDSLGVGHDVTVTFERSGTNDWIWRAVTDASETFDAAGAPFSTTEGSAFEIASGTLTFDTDGNLTAVTQADTAGWNFQGAAAQTITMDFGLDTTGATTDGSLRMSGNVSSVSSLLQDGMGAGELSGLEVEDDGTITGTYTNGEELVLGQVALATFRADSGLVRQGGTLFAASVYSGEPALGVAGTGGRGAVAGSALERSNVELEDQFVNMITYQRSYQANAKVITAADQSLQVLMSLV